jgi:hypothetical protein
MGARLKKEIGLNKSLLSKNLYTDPNMQGLMKGKLTVDQTWNKLARMGLIVDEKEHLANYEGVNGAWQDEPCFVIGCSKGLEGIDLDQLAGFHTIGINHLIDFWDKMEWHLFIDRRFLEVTRYNYEKFKGRKFASNKTGYFEKGATVFQLNNSGVTMGIQNGLYRGSLAGLCALNLAIISGANPIYMLGLDSGGLRDKSRGTHFRADYPGEKINPASHTGKYKQMNGWMRAFLPYRERIVNVDPKGELQHFRKMAFKDIPELKAARAATAQRVCHIQTLPMERMGEITRIIYEECRGKHEWALVDNLEPPRADVYILHCFSKRNSEFIHWQKPKGAKCISIIHSDKECYPASCSDKVVFLTAKHREKYKTTVPDEKAFVINGGLDTYFFDDPHKDYKKIVIGRICRSDPGKFHSRYFELCARMKEKYGAEIKIITPDPDKIGRKSGIRYESVVIADREAKKAALSEITIGLWGNGDFVDVFPLEVLELLSMRIPVVAYTKNQPAAREMFPGMEWETWEQVEAGLEALCQSESMRREQGRLSREKAVTYDKRKMVTLYNKIMEALK